MRPNVLLIVADDLGVGDVSATGAPLIETPAIDGLAASGARFLDAHSTSPICVPSRYSLLTGEYYWRVGNTRGRFFPRDRQLLIDPAKVTLGSLMKQAGYRTAFIGKWHLGLSPATHPLSQGFDRFLLATAKLQCLLL